MKKTEVLNTFFALVFTGKFCLQESQALVTTGKGWSTKDLLFVGKDQVKEDADWTYTSPWDMMECTHECCRSWLMSLQCHS